MGSAQTVFFEGRLLEVRWVVAFEERLDAFCLSS